MLPLADLPLHIEATLGAALLGRLARRNAVPLPTYDPAELTARYADFADLQAFLDVYYANLAVLRTAEDFADLARAYLARARAAGVRRAGGLLGPHQPPAQHVRRAGGRRGGRGA